MPPHQFGQHAAPPAHQPLRNAETLGLWHEPPRIRNRSYRRTLWPHIAALSVLVALLGFYAWTITEARIPTKGMAVAERVAR